MVDSPPSVTDILSDSDIPSKTTEKLNEITESVCGSISNLFQNNCNLSLIVLISIILFLVFYFIIIPWIIPLITSSNVFKKASVLTSVIKNKLNNEDLPNGLMNIIKNEWMGPIQHRNPNNTSGINASGEDDIFAPDFINTNPLEISWTNFISEISKKRNELINNYKQNKSDEELDNQDYNYYENLNNFKELNNQISEIYDNTITSLIEDDNEESKLLILESSKEQISRLSIIPGINTELPSNMGDTIIPSDPNSPPGVENDITSGDPSGGEPTGGDPTGGEPSGGDPAGADPVGGEPSSGEPSGVVPASGEPSGPDPASGEPSGADPASGEPSDTAPTSGEPSGTDLASGEPSGADPASGAGVADNEGTGGEEPIVTGDNELGQTSGFTNYGNINNWIGNTLIISFIIIIIFSNCKK